MNNVEMIDQLCGVVSKLAGIVREQGTYIEEQLAVDNAVRDYLAQMREEADREVDNIEQQLRPYIYMGRSEGGVEENAGHRIAERRT